MMKNWEWKTDDKVRIAWEKDCDCPKLHPTTGIYGSISDLWTEGPPACKICGMGYDYIGTEVLYETEEEV